MNEKSIVDIKKNGIIKIENFLDANELSKLSKKVSYYSAPKNDPKSYFPISFKTLCIKILKLDFVKFSYSLELWKFEKKKRLNYFADSFFGKRSNLYFIDAYYSKISKQAILPWHTDQAYHGKKDVNKFNNPDNFFLKIFIYLTDVGPNNGCTSYIPGSHKIGYAIRKSIYENKISYQPYWSLEDFKKILSDNRKYFDNYFGSSQLLNDFFSKTEFIDKKNGSNNNADFSFSAKAGTAIIFDEGGVHQGSKPQFNDRMVLRYLYSIKKS